MPTEINRLVRLLNSSSSSMFAIFCDIFFSSSKIWLLDVALDSDSVLSSLRAGLYKLVRICACSSLVPLQFLSLSYMSSRMRYCTLPKNRKFRLTVIPRGLAIKSPLRRMLSIWSMQLCWLLMIVSLLSVLCTANSIFFILSSWSILSERISLTYFL